MEASTPKPKTPETGIGSGGGSAPTAVIIRMPDSQQHAGLRRWMDRLEVDEMVLRETAHRERKHTVQQVLYAEPRDFQITDGMELYFVGHGSPQGFVGNVNEYFLHAWISERISKPPPKLKIKLVTCNAATEGNDGKKSVGIFAERLAQLLAGVATGKVVGFSGYLLSVPEKKAIYKSEPVSATLANPLAGERVEKWERELREEMAREFAGLLMPEERTVSDDAVTWAVAVICKSGASFNKLIASIKRFNLTRKDLAVGLLSSDNGIGWPSADRHKREDLETMLRSMQEKNGKVPGNSSGVKECARKAALLFKKWDTDLQVKTKEEWAWRKDQIIQYYSQEERRAELELKTSGQKVTHRGEYSIPGK